MAAPDGAQQQQGRAPGGQPQPEVGTDAQACSAPAQGAAAEVPALDRPAEETQEAEVAISDVDMSQEDQVGNPSLECPIVAIAACLHGMTSLPSRLKVFLCDSQSMSRCWQKASAFGE